MRGCAYGSGWQTRGGRRDDGTSRWKRTDPSDPGARGKTRQDDEDDDDADDRKSDGRGGARGEAEKERERQHIGRRVCYFTQTSG